MTIQNAPEARKVGLWISTALVVGNMIGSGVFLLPASLAPFGGISIVGWLFTSAGAVLLALVMARLARRIDPEEAARCIDEAYEALRWIDANVNEKLIFERLLLRLVPSAIISPER